MFTLSVTVVQLDGDLTCLLRLHTVATLVNICILIKVIGCCMLCTRLVLNEHVKSLYLVLA